MRPATLYTLQAQQVLAGSFVELRAMGKQAVFVSDPGSAIAPFEVDRFALPIHHVVCTKPPKVEPINKIPYDQAWEREDVFFAVEPALEEILSAPFKERLENAERDLGEAVRAFRRYSDCERKWLGLSFVKRVWKAIIGEAIW